MTTNFERLEDILKTVKSKTSVKPKLFNSAVLPYVTRDIADNTFIKICFCDSKDNECSCEYDCNNDSCSSHCDPYFNTCGGDACTANNDVSCSGDGDVCSKHHNLYTG
jgi:hypothetical protein